MIPLQLSGAGPFGIAAEFVYPIRLVVAIVILALAIAVGKRVDGTFTDLSERIALGEAVEETPLGALFEDTERVDRIVGLAARLVIYAAGAAMAASMANLNRLTEFLEVLVRYTASIAGAVAILLVGAVLAGYVGRAIREHDGLPSGGVRDLLASVTKAGLYFLVAILALDAVGYSTAILAGVAQALALGVGVGLALAVGIAVGLGSQDYVAEHVEDWLAD